MGPFQNWHWATKLIAGLGLFGSGILWLMDDPNAFDTVPVGMSYAAASASRETVAPRNARPNAQNSRPLSPLTHFSAMVERPLFEPGRRDAAATGNAVEPLGEGSSHPLIVLIGTIADGNGIRALISGPQGIRGVLVGEEIDGWDIVTIEARRLILRRHTEQIEHTILAPSR